MKNLKNNQLEKKPGLHPRNRHSLRYNFPVLINCLPALRKFVSTNKFDDESIDFANPEAVKTLNQALLKFFYKIDEWDIPKNYLCPPIPGRADYIHQMADLLGSTHGGSIPKGESVRVLDIGVGANCVYPLIATHEYGWEMVGSDIDSVALANAEKIVVSNKLDTKINLRLQTNSSSIFKGIIKDNEFFDLTISNPPFHSSFEESQAQTQRKIKNLGKHKIVLNFGGKSNELWCAGGEEAFVSRMISESLQFKSNCFWFTSLVSKATTLPHIYEELKKVNVRNFKTIDMSHGQKKSRIVAWTFLTPEEQLSWRNKTFIQSR